jgi:octaprenyl-diphosphate synthase
LRQFGLAFGTAYQLYDDCVDLFGSETAAGKSLGTDLAKGKLTLPVLLLWERASEAERRQMTELVECWETDSMKRLGTLMARHETLSSSLNRIHEYLEISRQHLHALPLSDGRAGLFGLTEYLARQTDALGVSA